MTCLRSPFLPVHLVASLCLGLLCAVPGLEAQANTQPTAATAAQPFDASSLRKPAEIGVEGLVEAGDNPAWTEPGFDDSKWLPVDAKTTLSEYFPNSRQPIIWQRIHIKVAPGQNEMALQAYQLARAFEVYVNGQKLIQSGHVEPYAPAMRNARLIVPIPEPQLRTGTLVIAIRARAPLTWWASTGPGFNGPMLTLGDETALRNKNLLSMIGENSANVLENLLSMGVGLVALALYISQRQQKEYLWIFVLGVLNVASLPWIFVSILRNIPVIWWFPNEVIGFAGSLAILLMVQAFLRRPLGWLLWLCITAAFLASTVWNVVYQVGMIPYAYGVFFIIPVGIILAVVIPILLFRQMRRGDREAGILLIPFLFYSLLVYVIVAAELLALVPPLRTMANHVLQTTTAFPLGIFTFGLGDVGSLSFNFSLAIIIVLRSARMSRQQALLESEVAAAREVQQVILPEQVESVPGFTVESIYHPAQQVGGDFFQIIPHKSDGSLLIVAGDVAGKGLQAGMLVALLVGAIRTSADTSPDPELVLHALNKRLLGRGQAQATCLALNIAEDGTVTLANAGHLPPYLNGEPVAMEGTLPLGTIEHAEISVMHFQLKDGDKLLLMSDGIVEATDAEGHLFGFDRVLDLLRAAATATEVATAAQTFGQEDDISIISVTRTAVLEPALA
jgi:hypothetical protein